MSTLNYFYSCCYLGIWVLCRAGLRQQSLPSYSIWILLLLGWLGTCRIEWSWPNQSSTDDRRRGADIGMGMLLQQKNPFGQHLFSRMPCVFHSSTNAGPWVGQWPAQPCHVHSSSTPLPSTVHTPRCGQTLVQEQCLDGTAFWRPVYSGRSQGDFSTLLPSIFHWCSICFCHMWNVKCPHLTKVHHCLSHGAIHNVREQEESLETSPCFPSATGKYRGTTELQLLQTNEFGPFSSKTAFVSAQWTEIMAKRKEGLAIWLGSVLPGWLHRPVFNMPISMCL